MFNHSAGQRQHRARDRGLQVDDTMMCDAEKRQVREAEQIEVEHWIPEVLRSRATQEWHEENKYSSVME
jgi:hypothetical protein